MKTVFFLALALTCSLLDTVAQEAKPSRPKKYTPEEAKSLIGKYATITGKVEQVRPTEKITHINFGKPHPYQDFTAVVFASRANLFPNLDKLPGKTVEVTGKVEEYQGKPQIVLVAKTQLKVVVEKDADKGETKPDKPERPKTDK